MNAGLLAGIRNKQPPWWGDQDAGNQQLFNVSRIGIMRSALPTAGRVLEIGGTGSSNNPDATLLLGETRTDLMIGTQYTWDVTTGGTLFTLNVQPTVTALVNMAAVYGFRFVPTVNGSGTITNEFGVVSQPQASAPVTTMTGIQVNPQAPFGTVGTMIGVEIKSGGVGATVTTMIGLQMTNLLAASTTWGMQVGNYQSYHQGPIMFGDASAPAASTAVEIKSTTGALLIPRMTTTQKNALTPINGMLIYDSTLNKIQCYQGGAWTSLA